MVATTLRGSRIHRVTGTGGTNVPPGAFSRQGIKPRAAEHTGPGGRRPGQRARDARAGITHSAANCYPSSTPISADAATVPGANDNDTHCPPGTGLLRWCSTTWLRQPRSLSTWLWSGWASAGRVSLLATSPGRPAQSELVEPAAEGLAELGFPPCRARISSIAIRICLLRARIRSRQASRADQCHDRPGCRAVTAGLPAARTPVPGRWPSGRRSPVACRPHR
jgi:hypothetical protein